MGDKKKIVIFGATGGIGRAIIADLAMDKNHLILIAKEKESLTKLAHELGQHGFSIETHLTDLEAVSAREVLCDNLIKIHGAIDWIIHGAGFVTKEDGLDTYNESIAKKIFEINFIAPFHITTKLSKKINVGGGIIFISSTAGLRGNGFVPTYASSKSALITFSDSLALSWSTTRKRSIALCPGATNTEMREKLAGDSASQQSPKVISSVINDVINDNSKYQNGSTIVVEGGIVSLFPND